jgi:sugar phosphate isomerase/epimerase
MVKPKIGLSTLYCLNLPFDEMTKHIPKMDTHYIEIMDEGLHALNDERVHTLNEIASSHNITYSVHAPFVDINIASPSKSLLKAMMKRLKKSLIHASDLNCQTWVFHPGLKTGVSLFYPGKDWDKNLESIQFLSNFAEDLGVNAAIENVPETSPFLLKNVEEFKEFYSQSEETTALVLDIGHANLNQQIGQFLTSFSNNIVHMHAHDNLGKSDQHLGIGRGNIDWNKTSELIKDISYTKTISVESIERVQQSIAALRNLLD